MASVESVKAKIQGLIDAANAATGAEDTDLTSAVEALIGGYGQGGEDTLAARLGDSLTTYSNDTLPAVVKSGFRDCTALQSISLPAATSVGNYAFSDCTALSDVELPQLTAIGEYAFYGCTALTEMDFPNLESTGGYGSREAFSRSGLTKAIFPKLQAMGYNFLQAAPVTMVDCHVLVSMQNQCFRYCSNLKVLILRSSSVVQMGQIGCFQNTDFYTGGAGGTVYVPAALVEEYKLATNWSVLYEGGSITFAAIEGSEFE